MIYQPLPIYDFRVLIGAGIVEALVSATTDFVAGENKPWTYYLGVGIGGAAAATGIPGATATIYAIAESVEVSLFHSPNGSLVRCYIDGLQDSVIDTYNPLPQWIRRTFQLGIGIKKRVDLVNYQISPQNTSGIAWMGISQTETINGIAQKRTLTMPVGIITYSIQDDNNGQKSLPIYFSRSALTLADIQAAANAYTPLLDAVIDGVITGVSTTLDLTLAGGIKSTPVASSQVERGALLTYNASGTAYSFSQSVPAWKGSLFNIDSPIVASGAGLAFVNAIVSGAGTTGSEVGPTDKYLNDLIALRKAVKNFRK